MGISKATARLLARSFRTAGLRGRCITFGVQGVELSERQCRSVLGEEGYPIAPVGAVRYDGHTQYGQTLHQDSFFALLGFNDVDSIDAFVDEGPSLETDLNHAVPRHLHDSYDLVYDGGTSEHCANPIQALANAMALCRPGGWVVHHLPINGYIDHGYYQFSPMLLTDLYKSNGFSDLKVFLQATHRHPLHPRGEWAVDYLKLHPGIVISSRMLGGRAVVFFAAKKGGAVNHIVWPMQGTANAQPGDRGGIVRQLIRGIPHLYGTALAVRDRLRWYQVEKLRLS